MQKTNDDRSVIERGTNRIELKCDDAVKDRISLTIDGENNMVVIEEMVDVADKLSIHIVDNDNVVRIGRGTTFEETSIAVADSNNYVIIGEDCMFARNTRIMASDFHAVINLETGERVNKSKGCIIDNHVWIGYGGVILKNTHIYSNSIVSAGAIVHGIVYANSIYVGSQVEPYKSRKEVTWERERQAEIKPLKLYEVKKKKFDAVKMTDDIIVNIENDIKACFHKIKGWAFWKNKDAKNSELYVYCLFQKDGEEKNWVVPLVTRERSDVAEYFQNKKYELCGFESYMPAAIVNNWQYIKKVELIIKNHFMCGRRILFDRSENDNQE